jgi:hypothetical protein
MSAIVRSGFCILFILLLSTGVQGYASHSPTLSADGMYAAFDSDATNLVTGDTNGLLDVFVRDRQTGTTYLVSKS